eukprot:654880-Rhodomonas_salina.1
MLNPYISRSGVTSIIQLVLLTMLRANRMGHVNRCVGLAVALLGRLRKAETLGLTASLAAEISQGASSLADMLASRRHFVTMRESKAEFDPRFLMFVAPSLLPQLGHMFAMRLSLDRELTRGDET